MRGITTIWRREVLNFIRSKSRIIGSMGMPIFFLLFIGTGVGSVIGQAGGVNYVSFMAPGIIGMILLFGSIFSGLNVVFDKQFGFMKEMLVAPISREDIVIGKALGGATSAIVQGLLLLVMIYALGILEFNPLALAMMVPLMLIMSMGFVSIGLIFASRLDDPHGFQLIMNFLIMPMFFLSSAFFPLDGLPQWLQVLSFVDPLTYGVDAMRGLLVGQSYFPLWMDISVLGGFTIVLLLIAAWAFRGMKTN